MSTNQQTNQKELSDEGMWVYLNIEFMKLHAK